MIGSDFKCDLDKGFNPHIRRSESKVLEDAVCEALKRYIKNTGMFPSIEIAVSDCHKKFGVAVIGERWIK